MNIYNFLFAQDNADLREWKEIECENIDKINCQIMQECETGDTRYILSEDKDPATGGFFIDVYKIMANENEATLEFFSRLERQWLSNKFKLYLKDEENIYCIYFYNGYKTLYFWIDLLGIPQDNYIEGYYTQELEQCNFQCFMIDNMHYFLSNTNGLKQLAINGENILHHTCEGFSYASKENTSIVVLKDTLYYFSESGFCSAKISGTQVENKLVSNVEVTNEKSVLVTDKEDRIWIINNQDGVIEYNTIKETAKQIANFPVSFNNNREDEIYTRASFYSNNYLYYITDNKMFSLDVTPQEDPDNPDPDNPTRPHDQSGHTCGLLGLEFIFILAGLSFLCKYHK